MTLKQGSECIMLFVGCCIKCSCHDHAFVCMFVLCDLLKILLFYSLHRATSDVSMYQQSLNRVKVHGVCYCDFNQWKLCTTFHTSTCINMSLYTSTIFCD